jgi:hypothetical protein
LKLSKANLAAAAIASADGTQPAIHRLHVEADGSTVAAGTNARAFMAVSPVDPARAAQFPDVEGEEAAPGPDGVGVPLDVARSASTAIPKENRGSLHYVQLTRCSDREVELMATDGMRKRKHSGMPMRGRFPEWRGAVGAARAATRTRVCFDAKVLMQALSALLKACPDPGNRNPVFAEVGGSHDAVVLRGVNYESNQRAVVLVKPLDTGGQWPEDSEWEAGLKAKPVARRIVREEA